MPIVFLNRTGRFLFSLHSVYIHMFLRNHIVRARTWAGTYKKEIALFVVVALMMSCVFGLGYLWGRDASSPPIVIEKNSN